MKNFFSFGLLFFLFSCATSKNTIEEIPQTKTAKFPIYKTAATLGKKEMRNTTHTILLVEIKENRMFIDLNYSGSCEAVEFKAIGLEVSPTAIQPIRQIQLYQSKLDYDCVKERQITIVIDISEILMNKEKGGSNYFLLDGWPNRIEYIVP